MKTITKSSIFFLLGCSFINGLTDVKEIQKIISKYTRNGLDLTIYGNSENMSKVGYGNCNFLQNGESLVIKNFMKKNDIIMDVGAHIGDWSRAVFKEVECAIYAFEPIPETYQSLKKLDDKVFCFNLALGKEEAQLEMNYFFQQASDCSSLYNRSCLNYLPVKKVRVKVTSLDTFTHAHNITHIHFLKIDTEGAELDVLKGCRGLISRKDIDIIQFEYGGTYPDAHITLLEVYRYLTSNGYLIFRIIPDGLIYIPEWDDRLENYEYSNYLAILTDGNHGY